MSRAFIALAAIPALPVLAAYAWRLESQRLALELHWDWDNQPPLGERLCERVASEQAAWDALALHRERRLQAAS